MKALIFVLFLMSASAYSEETALKCNEPMGTSSTDYNVSISKDRKGAIARENKTTLGELECQKTGQAPSHPDAIYTTLICLDPNIQDGGYSVRLKQGGVAGRTTAVLSEVNFSGEKPLVELLCRPSE